MYSKEVPATIQSMFNTIAKRYDLTNALLSLTMHSHWNKKFISLLPQQSSPHHLIDLCAGTGDITFRYLKKNKIPCHAYLIDFSSEMLAFAKKKAQKISHLTSQKVSYIESDVQNIPLPHQFAECATVAYGIRNVQNIPNFLNEVLRLLKPGGCFAILELTQPQHPFLRWGHRLYLKTILPLFGKYAAANKEAYQYLCQSIQHFIAPKQLEIVLKDRGFENISIHPLMGGIATIILCYKSK